MNIDIPIDACSLKIMKTHTVIQLNYVEGN